ncbi:MAG: hypothetical protein FWH17_06205 [Oscillospiraceae bacterium]|nr:hypothetical protein [Oscillospiraceae bacterium]
MKKSNVKWIIKITLISLVAAAVFTLASTQALGYAGYILSFGIVAIFIVIGIIFDIIGIAATAADEAPFNSMATHRQRGAAQALRLIKNADKVNSFCSDVVGDVTGIVSGGAAALIAARLMEGFSAQLLIFPIIISSTVTALTVGGKAIGKTIAFGNSTGIMLGVGKILYFFKNPAAPRRAKEKQSKRENQDKKSRKQDAKNHE